MGDYRELRVWQRGIELVEAVYRTSGCFPREEIYGLTSQLRRAAVSVPSNIAEGHGRRTTKEFLGFLSIARGSLKELETQVTIAQRLRYISTEKEQEVLRLTTEVGRLITALAKALRKRLS